MNKVKIETLMKDIKRLNSTTVVDISSKFRFKGNNTYVGYVVKDLNDWESKTTYEVIKQTHLYVLTYSGNFKRAA